jgi:hypothetical protein
VKKKAFIVLLGKKKEKGRKRFTFGKLKAQ